MATKYSVGLRNAQLDVISGASGIGGSGLLRIYSGTRPANVATAITGTLLAQLTLNATFAPAAASGVLTANAITGDTSADATGTATHFRIWKSDGTTAVIDGPVNVTSLVITRGNA